MPEALPVPKIPTSDIRPPTTDQRPILPQPPQSAEPRAKQAETNNNWDNWVNRLSPLPAGRGSALHRASRYVADFHASQGAPWRMRSCSENTCPREHRDRPSRGSCQPSVGIALAVSAVSSFVPV
jgi:hypothetical protein